MVKGCSKVVVLVGFSGAGKTTVAKALQEGHRWKWIDLDDEIERKSGVTIKEIIRVEGEQRFRELEREALIIALDREADVISLGGGALLNENNRSDLLQRTLLVELAVGLDAATERIAKDEAEARRKGFEVVRPLLSSEQGELPQLELKERVKQLMKAREGLYDVAPVKIFTDWASPADVASLVVSSREDWMEFSQGRGGKPQRLVFRPGQTPRIKT